MSRYCPQCGRMAQNPSLTVCPECRVPFVQNETPSTSLTPEQVRLIALQIFGSWKFWAGFVVIVGVAAWAVIAVADRVIDARAKTYMATLEQNATNRIGSAFGQISNQIAAEFRGPRIKAAIEQVARDHALNIFSNGVSPSLDAFQDALDLANKQLAQGTNLIAQLERQAREAQQRIPPPSAFIAAQPTNPVIPATTTPAPATPTPAAATPPASNALKLSLVNHTVVQAGSSYMLTMFFQAANATANGTALVEAGTYKQTARILNFASMATGPSSPPTYNETGDAARLQFAVTPQFSPTLMLELSAPTIVRLSSDSFDADITLPVAADKLQLPSANK